MLWSLIGCYLMLWALIGCYLMLWSLIGCCLVPDALDLMSLQVHQVEMEGVVRGIQADMTKLSKSHSHTSNTVSKLLDKSRKLSVTMKEVRDKMERQGVQVRKLEANHAHLVNRNQFKVLIFQVRGGDALSC
ncbi:hypothetical protein KUCAC02_033682 [Chaenocephalus aceratus]|nr:hypothetical protein KUCAC02_033682 [Chaenocephalus aceratus]